MLAEALVIWSGLAMVSMALFQLASAIKGSRS